MGKLIPATVSRAEVLRYLRDTEHQIIDVLERDSENGKTKRLGKDGISFVFDNICAHIYRM